MVIFIGKSVVLMRIALAFSLLLCFSNILAQSTLRAKYDMTLNMGKLESPKLYKFKTDLIVSNDKSLFTYKKAVPVSHDPSDGLMKEHYFLDALEGQSTVDVIELDSIGFMVYYDHKTKKTISREVIAKNSVLIDEVIDYNNWYYIDSSKTVDEQLCFLAQTYFRGRTYYAWFNPKIAVKDGPWKLKGLPGLVYEAYSDDQTIIFTLTELSKSNENISIKTPTANQQITFKEYWQLYLEKRYTEFQFYKSTVIKELIDANLDTGLFRFPIFHNSIELLTSDISMLITWSKIDS